MLGSTDYNYTLHFDATQTFPSMFHKWVTPCLVVKLTPLSGGEGYPSKFRVSKRDVCCCQSDTRTSSSCYYLLLLSPNQFHTSVSQKYPHKKKSRQAGHTEPSLWYPLFCWPTISQQPYMPHH